ncbi:MAG: S9 family peptidase [Vicinamibacteraceae bacterium]
MAAPLLRRVLAIAVTSLLLVASLAGQTADRVAALDAQLVRIFDTRAFAVPRFGPARWLADGSGYTVLETGKSGGSNIVRYDARTGARSVLVDAARLTPPGAATPLAIDDYTWSADGRRLLVFTNTARVWRDHTRGDYWVLGVQSGSLRKLGGAAPASTLMFAKFSPDGSRVAYVRANNLYTEAVDGGRIAQLTRDGSTTTINGTSDWVYEEELFLRDCFRWSPDGTALAYWQFDTTGIENFTLINNTASLYPTITRIPYPKVGTKNSAVRIGVVGARGGKTKWMRTPGDPREHYLARLDWVDGRTLAIQQLNRLQNRNDLLLADARSGETRSIFHDQSKAWVEVVDGLPWLENGQAFLSVSERDGWRHVYRVRRDSGEATLVTRFEADVTDVVSADVAAGWLYFRASPDDATRRYLYRSRLDGTGAPERLTPADSPGTHDYQLAPGSRFAFHTVSGIDRPPVTSVIELPDHRPVRTLTDTSALGAALVPILVPPVEFFQVEIAGGVRLDGWMLKPSHFDASRKYPVIAYVYGEPWSQTVVDRWGGNRMLFHRALAEAGYILVSIDNRGTPAPRGRDWRQIVYGAVGDLSSKDQAAAMLALAAKHPFIDRERLGIWGWSGGGSNTLNAMFRFPDVYQVGVSVAPVPDQRLYDTIYQERYMGLPSSNEAGYRLGSALSFADGLKGKLLIVHGSGDDNVHIQGTERLVDRLVELGKPFDLMIYPNRTHAISEGAGTALHLHRLIARYFLTNLPPGPR